MCLDLTGIFEIPCVNEDNNSYLSRPATESQCIANTIWLQPVAKATGFHLRHRLMGMRCPVAKACHLVFLCVTFLDSGKAKALPILLSLFTRALSSLTVHFNRLRCLPYGGQSHDSLSEEGYNGGGSSSCDSTVVFRPQHHLRHLWIPSFLFILF